MNSADLAQYFTLTPQQQSLFDALEEVYKDWNEKINVISRKDIENFYERHVLHSLAIAKVANFKAGDTVLDIGTGGGFPGIPLAILFPEVKFTLVDSIQKKIKVVAAVAETLNLPNVKALCARAEAIPQKFDYAVTRAVAPVETLFFWLGIPPIPSRDGAGYKIKKGLYCLKGGDLTEELENIHWPTLEYPLQTYFPSEFFETKKILSLQLA